MKEIIGFLIAVVFMLVFFIGLAVIFPVLWFLYIAMFGVWLYNRE